MSARAKKPRGQIWPNMRRDTYAAINDELVRARTKHPLRDNNLWIFNTAIQSLLRELDANTNGLISAGQVYARAAQVAAMAIRILEEGAAGHKYAGNSHAPEFKLTSE